MRAAPRSARAAIRGYLTMWALVFAVAVGAGVAANRGRALVFAAAILLATGLAHSLAGERFILVPLFRRELPRMLGDRALTARTLRFVWHEFTIGLWTAGALLASAADGVLGPREVARSVAVAFAGNAALSFVVSRGRHYCSTFLPSSTDSVC